MMNTSLAKTFTFEDTNVRTSGTAENPLFCVKDVCDVLGIKTHRKKIQLLEADEKDVVPFRDSIGRKQNIVFCNESGLYSIIMSCHRNPRTQAFQRWVCREVLPSIRRTGSYSLPKQDNLIEHRKLDLEFCKFAKELFPDCDRMKHLVKEKVASILNVGGPLAITEEMPLTVTEILEQTQGLERKLIHKHRSRFGRLVVGSWRKDRNCEPQKLTKYCNGHSCKVNAYPADYHDEIRGMWLAFLQTM